MSSLPSPGLGSSQTSFSIMSRSEMAEGELISGLPVDLPVATPAMGLPENPPSMHHDLEIQDLTPKQIKAMNKSESLLSKAFKFGKDVSKGAFFYSLGNMIAAYAPIAGKAKGVADRLKKKPDVDEKQSLQELKKTVKEHKTSLKELHDPKNFHLDKDKAAEELKQKIREANTGIKAIKTNIKNRIKSEDPKVELEKRGNSLVEKGLEIFKSIGGGKTEGAEMSPEEIDRLTNPEQYNID